MPIVEFAFTAGLDQGTDPRRTVKLTMLTNYVWTKRGMIERRPGYTTLPLATYPVATSVVSGFTVTAGGSGYTNGALVLTLGGGGISALGTLVVSAGAVHGVTLVGVGAGFLATPTAVIDGTGSGAIVTVNLGAPTGGGSAISTVRSLASAASGALQAADNQRLLALDGGSMWTTIGTLPNVVVTTVPTPLQSQPCQTLSAVSQPANWLNVSCAGLNVWWTSDQYVVLAGDGSIIQSVGTVDTTLPAMAMTTDGTSYVFQFAAVGSNIFSQYLLVTSGTTGARFGMGQFPTYGGGSGFVSVAMPFDAVWNPVSGQLVTAYNVTGSSQITMASWNFTPDGLDASGNSVGWTPGGFTSGIGFAAGSGAATVKAISLCTSANGGWAATAVAYSRSGLLCVDVMAVTSATFTNASTGANIYAQPTSVTDDIYNVSIVSTSDVSDLLYTVAFTASTVVGGSGVNSSVNSLLSFDVVADVEFSGGWTVTASVSAGTLTVCQALGSRLWAQDGDAHGITYSTAGQTYFVHDFAGQTAINGSISVPSIPALPIATFLGREGFAPLPYGNVAQGVIQKPWGLPVPTASAGVVSVPVTLAPEPAANSLLQVLVATVDYTQVRGGAPSPAGTSLLYPAGIPTMAGDAHAFEAQFMAPPTILAVTNGGGTLGAGVYTWFATYAKVLDDGSILESLPSAPFTVTNPGGSSYATVYVTQYALNQGIAVSSDPQLNYGLYPVTVILYRNADSNGTTYFRVTEDPFTTVGGSGNAYQNRPFLNAQGYVDGHTASQIQGNAQIPTAGGVFGNVCPDACTMLAQVRDRIWLAGTPDGATVFYSDAISSAASCNFHDEQTIVLSDGGPVTGVGTIDNNVYIFKADSIFGVYGVEGTNTGVGNTLSTPQKLPTGAVGCISHGSIVSVPEGLMFQSSRGIELLDRSQSIQFIGETVKDVSLGTVVAALSFPSLYQVRFFGSNGAVIVYSTLAGQWSVFSYRSLPSAQTTAAAIVNGSPAWAWKDDFEATILTETMGAYSDNGSSITSQWTSGWMTLGEGLEGYRRYRSLQVLGTYGGSSDVEIFVSSNYSSSAAQTSLWTSAEIAAIPGFDFNRVQLEVLPLIQRAESVQVSLIESSQTKGTVWESLTFEVFTKPGRFRGLAAAARGRGG